MSWKNAIISCAKINEQ